MISIDVIVHALGLTPDDRQNVALDEGNYQAIPPGISDRQAAFYVSFEDVAARLGALARLFFEPDGSFVWVGESWQLDGLVADRGGRVVSIQIWGTCPAEALERLLHALDWPQVKVTFELTRAGVLLDEAEFRRISGWE